MEVILKSSEKEENVISALRGYLNPKLNEPLEKVDVEADIRQVLTLMQNSIKHGINIKTEFSNSKYWEILIN